jgi:hypothetical protein
VSRNRAITRSRWSVTLLAALAILVGVGIVTNACGDGGGGAEPDTSGSEEPALTRLSATPVPFPLASLTSMDAIVASLRDLRIRLEGEIGEGQAAMYTTSIRLEEAPGGGAGYVHKVSKNELEIIVYPTGQTLRLENADSADIKQAPLPGDTGGVASITIADLKPRQLVTFLSPPSTRSITFLAFNTTWR